MTKKQEDRISELQRQVTNLQNSNIQLNQENAAMKAQIANSKQKINTQTQQINSLTDKNAQLKKTINDNNNQPNQPYIQNIVLPDKPLVVFIDTENVAYDFRHVTYRLREQDTIIWAYTNQKTNIPFDTLAHLCSLPCSVKLLHCYNQITNALDFQICALLGSFIERFQDDKAYRIISGDKGFVAMTRLYRDFGYDVSVIGTISQPNPEGDAPKPTNPGEVPYGTFIDL